MPPSRPCKKQRCPRSRSCRPVSTSHRAATRLRRLRLGAAVRGEWICKVAESPPHFLSTDQARSKHAAGNLPAGSNFEAERLLRWRHRAWPMAAGAKRRLDNYSEWPGRRSRPTGSPVSGATSRRLAGSIKARRQFDRRAGEMGLLHRGPPREKIEPSFWCSDRIQRKPADQPPASRICNPP